MYFLLLRFLQFDLRDFWRKFWKFFFQYKLHNTYPRGKRMQIPEKIISTFVEKITPPPFIENNLNINSARKEPFYKNLIHLNDILKFCTRYTKMQLSKYTYGLFL